MKISKFSCVYLSVLVLSLGGCTSPTPTTTISGSEALETPAVKGALNAHTEKLKELVHIYSSQPDDIRLAASIIEQQLRPYVTRIRSELLKAGASVTYTNAFTKDLSGHEMEVTISGILIEIREKQKIQSK